MYFKKRCGLAALSAILLISGVSGCSQAAAEETVSETRISVVTTRINPGSIQNRVTFAGQIKANESISVVGKMAGKVESAQFDIGDRVEAGDILYTLEKKDVENQIKQLEASLNTASVAVNSAQTGLKQVTGGQMQSSIAQLESGIENAQQNVTLSESGLEAARLAIENAELQLEDITKTYENTKTLFEAGVASRSQMDSITLAYDQVVAAKQQAEIQYEQAELRLEQALIGQRQAVEMYEITTGQIISDSQEMAANSVNNASAQRNAVSVQLAIARSTLDDLSVTSPMSGVVTAKNVKAGEMASSAVPAYVIEDIDTVSVVVKVSEIIINKIVPGQEVDIYVKTLGEDALKGTVKTVSPSADATNMYPVKIEIENKDGVLKPGMFAEAHFVKEKSENTIVVLRDAVLQDENGRFVYVDDNGIARRTAVETGIDTGSEIEILAGLAEGDAIVTTGQTNLIDGDKLNVINTI